MSVVILGAGPAGLGAAWRLQQSGTPWVLLERADRPGGLAASFQSGGFTWDIGGHILFSHYPSFDRILDEVAPSRDAWCLHQRRAFIRIHDLWVPYPFQYNIRHLPADEQRRCLQGVEDAPQGAHAAMPANFEAWIRQSMGAGLADLFMLPYNRKVWAGSLAEMSAHWVGERVAVPDAARMRRHLADATDDVDWGPNNQFRFPREGGTGAIWARLAAHLPAGRLRFRTAATAVHTGRRVVTAGGKEYPYDALISTIPLNRLVALAGLEDLAPAVSGLVRTRTWVGGVGLAGPAPAAAQDKCWMYFPETEYPFYRATVLSNYSPRVAPEGCYALMVEVSSRPEDPPPDTPRLLRDSLLGLKRCGLAGADAQPLRTWSYCAAHGYPVPSLGRDAILTSVLPVLENLGVYSRGRFGAWKYEVGNMDHAFMQGVEVARRILTGEPEETLACPARVNAPRIPDQPPQAAPARSGRP